MNMRNRILFTEILERQEELNKDSFWYDEDFYNETKRLGDSINYSKFKCDNKVFRLANAYVAEVAIRNYLMNRFNTNIDYMDELHDYLEFGNKEANPDLIDKEDGTTFEIKCGNHSVENYDFDLNNNHNATFTLFYDRYKKSLYDMNYEDRDYKKIAKFEINLPFPKN